MLAHNLVGEILQIVQRKHAFTRKGYKVMTNSLIIVMIQYNNVSRTLWEIKWNKLRLQ